MSEMVKGLLESGKPIAVGPGVREQSSLTLDELRAEVGRRIQFSRWKERLTVKQLAVRSKIHESVLQRYEAGKLSIGVHVIKTIAKALGVRPSELSGRTEDD